MPNYMSMGGRTYNIASNPGMTPAAFYGGNSGGAAPYISSEEEDRTNRRRQQQWEEQRKQDDAARIAAAMYGMSRGPQADQGGPQRGFYDGPIASEMGGLGGSYKTRGNAPRYHEEIPMGGTPGVWAIRNDEIGGPRSDPFQNMSPREWADSIRSGIGRRFKRRYR